MDDFEVEIIDQLQAIIAQPPGAARQALLSQFVLSPALQALAARRGAEFLKGCSVQPPT